MADSKIVETGGGGMFGRMRRRLGLLGRVEFCEACGQVCTPQCRAQARLDRTRTEAMYLTGFPR